MTTLLLSLLMTTSPQPSSWVEFIGFSKDEQIVAYREDINQKRADGTHDQYSLYHTLDSESGYTIASFRATAIHRLTPRGRPLRISKKKLHRDNPRFAKAYSNRKWRKLRKRKKFDKTLIPVDGQSVQLHFDNDIRGQQQQSEGATHMVSPSGTALGFAVIAQDTAGFSVPVGVARLEGAAGQHLAAKGQLYLSSSGKTAVWTTIFLSRYPGAVRSIPRVQVTRFAQPIALQTAPSPVHPKSRQVNAGPVQLRARVSDAAPADGMLRQHAQLAYAKLTPKNRRELRRRARQMETMVHHFTGHRSP